MFLLRGKKQLGQSGFFDGLTDCHSHILPGVDDGVKTMDESLRILSLYEQTGVSSLWLTPHIMEDIPNTTGNLRSSFDELVAAYSADRIARGTSRPAVRLHLGSENMLDSLFCRRLESNDLLPLPGGRLLVETSFFNPPYNLYELLERIKSAGYFPVLAHPERYVYMSESDYGALRDRGVLFQANIFSFLGFYRSGAMVRAEYLLKGGFYSLLGTDLHKEKTFAMALNAGISTKILDNLNTIKII